MRRAFVVTFAVGLIVALFGLIWALQGFGVLGGSPMSNTTTWTIIGPITAAIGIVIAVFSWRKISWKERLAPPRRSSPPCASRWRRQARYQPGLRFEQRRCCRWRAR